MTADKQRPQLEKFVTLSLSESGSGVHASPVRRAGAAFTVVTEDDVPISVLRKDEVAALDVTAGTALGEVRGSLPPILELGKLPGDREEVEAVIELMDRTGTERALLYMGSTPAGIVTRALLDETLVRGHTRDVLGLSVPTRAYVCHECNPARYAFPRSGGPPRCPLHGEMTPEE